MQLRFSVLAGDRAFSKAMRRVRVKVRPLLDAFDTVKLEHPIHEAILVGITDEQESGYFDEVENSDGFFQVMAGCSHGRTDDELTLDVFDILWRTVRLCPFATPDRDNFEALFARLRPTLLNT